MTPLVAALALIGVLVALLDPAAATVFAGFGFLCMVAAGLRAASRGGSRVARSGEGRGRSLTPAERSVALAGMSMVGSALGTLSWKIFTF